MSITDDLTGNFQQVTINTGGILLTPMPTMSHSLTTTDPASIAANTSSDGLPAVWALYYFNT